MDSKQDITQADEGFSKLSDEKIAIQPSPLPPWDMYTVAVSLFSGYILLPLIVSNVITLINPFLDRPTELFVQQATTILTWAGIFAILRLRYGKLGPYLGIRFPGTPRIFIQETIKLLLATTVVLWGLTQLWALLQSQYPNWFLGTEEPYAHASQAERIVLFIFAVCFAPVLEELIFRGLVQSTFHKISTPIRSVLFTGLVFLLLHGSYFNNIRALVTVLCLGLCFGIWRERTQSLLPGMVVHLLNNILASVLLLFS